MTKGKEMGRKAVRTEGNIIPQLLAAAKRHPDHAAIQAIAQILGTSIQMAQTHERDHTTLLAGYRNGLAGKEGYGLMHMSDTGSVDAMIREIGAMREVAGIVLAMIAVMETVGETFDY
jgi:hypothetical protein